MEQDNYFDGVLDEVRIYNRALSQAEIQYLSGIYAVVVGCVGSGCRQVSRR
ncbi:MAG: LamG-like jellyroll fold domain-containing protein [Planctomycetota bacterium]